MAWVLLTRHAMRRRIERAVRSLREHAGAARELSVGALEALTAFTAGGRSLEVTYERLQARVRRELPGF